MLADLSILELSACRCSFVSYRLPSFRISLPTESLQPEELAAAYSKKSFAQQSFQQEELWIASSRMSFQKESMQQDELQLAYLHQLDPGTSLSFTQYGSISLQLPASGR